MPADTNANGDIFGGWLLSQMDLGGGVFRVSARLPVDELGDLFGLELDDDEVDSVGGLLTKALGRLPVSGSITSVSGLVLRADRTEGRRRRVSTVVVERDEALIDVQSTFTPRDAAGNETTPAGMTGHPQ